MSSFVHQRCRIELLILKTRRRANRRIFGFANNSYGANFNVIFRCFRNKKRIWPLLQNVSDQHSYRKQKIYMMQVGLHER